MSNTGVFTLAALQITAATPKSLLTPILALDRMTAVTLEASFAYGSGAGTVIAIVATTFDGGTTWRHIARFDFAVAPLVKTATITKAPEGVTIYSDLGSEGVNNGILGNQLAVFLTTTGTYASNTVLSVRASVS